MAIKPLSAPHHSHGFTLVELMVVIALFAILVLGTASLGRAWVANAHATNAENLLLQSYKQARATALINNNAVSGTAAAATLSITSTTISVTDGGGNTVYSVSPPADTTVTLTCGSSLALSNSAVPTASACQASLAYTISVTGGSNVSGTLY
jgi:prepilin-type N-terminal cleavage/methylation domain-containing protein